LLAAISLSLGRKLFSKAETTAARSLKTREPDSQPGRDECLGKSSAGAASLTHSRQAGRLPAGRAHKTLIYGFYLCAAAPAAGVEGSGAAKIDTPVERARC